MSLLDVTFDIPNHIANGLTNQTLERVGGVVRNTKTKEVVMWLKETSSSLSPNLMPLLQLGSAASILNLGVSAIGFTVIMHRLNELEQRLLVAQEVLNRINQKIDIGFYAKFRAALDLAVSAFSANKPENRRDFALSAINFCLEAEHIYINYVDQEIEKRSQAIDEYLLTLFLAYIAEVRCHLELGDPDLAVQRFQEGSKVIRPRVQKYIELLLTSNSAAYLHPQFKEQISLRKLTKIYQWIEPSLDESNVFEIQRENLFYLSKNQEIESGYEWINSLPPAIVANTEVQGSIFGNRQEMSQEAMKRLPQVFEMMESMIETHCRFEAYQTEVKAIAQLGISFHDWLQLAPQESQPEDSNLMYIIPAEPLSL